MEIGFSLGSNLNDRKTVIIQAKEKLLAEPGVQFAAQSSLYETEPVGVNPEYQDLLFLNSVLIIESEHPLETWLERLGAIEYALGRRRTEDRFAPRPIDIDILYGGDQYIDSGGLIVPHPRWAQRRFVVEPLAEVRPDLVLPGVETSVADILKNLSVTEIVTRLPDTW